MKKKPNATEDIKADLKHDTMEFSAATDGDDKLDTDDETYEEEEISGDELDLLEAEPRDEAEALNAAEMDRSVDSDNLPEEDWTEDLSDTGEDEDDAEHTRV